ncbi:MAG: Trm112 family protein [Thermoguttaceae bacterium]|nr:Trm112 family protein [Thermoguttaceae bacterium]
MIDQEFLDLLVCPENHTSLRLADEALVARLNALIAAGKLVNCGGQAVREAIQGGLVREDGRRLYPIMDNIPVLLIDEAIALEPSGGEQQGSASQ